MLAIIVIIFVAYFPIMQKAFLVECKACALP